MRPRRRRRCAVIAHRGGGGEAPENTWSSLEHTAKLGLDWMETDLRATSDGVVVLAHDPGLERTTGDPRRIEEMRWADLAAVDAGDGRPPVRLDEALEEHPGLALNTDLKADGVVEAAIATVRRAGALDRVRFSSFSSRRLGRARALEPSIRSSLGTREIAALLLAAEAALPSRLVRRAVLDRLSHGARADAVQIPVAHWGVPVTTRRLIAAAHTAGMEVHVWTVDEPHEMRRLAGLGVDAIITDRPSLALRSL
ncbi:glycerophosphodiester phosphodiesterase [Actinomyces timonensis]|uniref:glycerophosphodiester phosphodiesterase n=1 Tax=Actinomyces timonensis TaxID=1288391 RepID=UPI00030BBCB9|nr:glycerophosphodiester phosphodiesterase [Actinomyces timonensis]